MSENPPSYLGKILVLLSQDRVRILGGFFRLPLSLRFEAR